GLKYDVGLRKLRCDHCSNTYDPYIFDTVTKDAEKQDYMETSVFVCPGCGAELLWTDETDITASCQYCGNERIIFDRMENEKRPQDIIPFSVTKEECKKAYEKAARRAILSPRAVKDSANIDSFRGIYMPYWEYTAGTKGRIYAEGRMDNEEEKDGYIYTTVYSYEADVEHEVTGSAAEASEQFDKEISRSLGPYKRKDMRPFTPGFLSGFYAENAGASDTESKEDLKKIGKELHDQVSRAAEIRNSGYGTLSTWNMKLPDEKRSRHRILLPVWFMSFKKDKDNITYSAVNGSTGKVAVDFPLSIPKVALFAAAVALIAFLIFFSAGMTLRPQTSLAISGFILMLSFYLSFKDQVTANIKIGNGKKVSKKALVVASIAASVITIALLHIEPSSEYMIVWFIVFCVIFYAILNKIVNGPEKRSVSADTGRTSVVPAILAVPVIILLSLMDRSAFTASLFRLVFYVSAIFMIVYGYSSFKNRAASFKNIPLLLGYLGFAFAAIVTSGVFIIMPMNKYYYLASVLNTVLFFAYMIRIFAFRYKRAYKRPPQFNKKGGDNSAK
ncbi:MAG: hypothetical protein IJS94_03265, partial [Clostridia bacterium]|nr:hypothetical protein [Clostridia bacterium]